MALPVEIERITEEIRREVEKRGAELVELQFARRSGRGFLTVLADKPGGISLDECAEINRELGQFLDRLSEGADGGPMALRGAYNLEVCSPGLDRPLRTERDFSRVVGGRVRLVWREADGRTLDARGLLVRLQDGALEVERDHPAGTICVPLSSVVKAVRDIKV